MTITIPIWLISVVAVFATASVMVLAILGAGLVWYVFTK